MSLAVALLTSGVISAVPPAPSFPLPPELAPAAPRTPPAQPACDPTQVQLTAGGKRSSATPLADLPMGVQHMTVLRKVGDCSIATVKLDGRTYWVPVEESRDITPLGGR
jgi:hypothetical protein